MTATLKPLSKDSKKRKIKFATADIEASEWINFNCIGFFDGNKDQYLYFETLDDFFKETFSYCKKNKIQNIFMHNGGKYDFNFLLGRILFMDEFEVSGLIPRGSGLLCFSIQRKDDNSKKPFKLIFRDSIALLPFGLRKLAESFKVPCQKEEIDYVNMQKIFDRKDYVPDLMTKTSSINKGQRRYVVYYKDKEVTRYNPKRHKHEFMTYLDKDTNILYHKIFTKDDLLSYLEADCISLWQILHTFYQWPLVKQAGPTFTIASQAIKIWQLFLKDPIYKISENADEFIRRGYYGGRTEVFRPLYDATYDTKKNPAGFEKDTLKILKEQGKTKTLNYVDVNSLYPFAMLNEFPIKLDCVHYNGKYYDKDKMGMWECLIEVPKKIKIPPLPVKHIFEDGTEKLIFATGKLKGVWTTLEIEYAKSLGCKVLKIYEGITFVNGGHIFKEYIETLYSMRLEAKKIKDGVTDLLCKLLMNSTYGKLGLNLEREQLEIDVGQLGVKLHSEVRDRESGKSVRLMSRPKFLETSFVNCAIPAYVTSHARIHMHKNVIRKAGYDHCYYMDTDSLFTTKELPTGEKLGELKLEYTTKSSVFLLPKSYINDKIEGESFEKKITMKGFDRRKVKTLTFEDFRDTLRGETDRILVEQDSKFATLKTALRKGHFLIMENDPETNKKVDKERLIKDENYLASLEKIPLRERDQYVRDEIKRTVGRIRNRKKKLQGEYTRSTRSIKSRYDKRTILPDLIRTEALHIDHSE